nr:hypothetical protein [Calditrichia bacterium]
FSVKNGISLVNDVGIIDEDYCGPEDELRIAVIRHYNPRDPLGSEPFVVERGTRFAQIIFHRHAFEKIEWEEMENPDFAGQTRGGFGSTGKK